MLGKTRFEELAIEKQNLAYKEGYAKKQFTISCHKCCYENKRHGECASCPIKTAHIKALTEIAQGKRGNDRVQYGAKKSYTRKKDGSIVVTIVIS